MLGNYAAALKFGGKISQREKTNNTDEWKYEDFSTVKFKTSTLNSHYELGQFGPTINENAIKDKISGLNPNDVCGC